MMNLEEAAKVKARTYTNCLLLLIVILLLGIAVRPFVVPQTAWAQSTSSDPFLHRTGDVYVAGTGWQPAGIREGGRRCSEW